MATTNRQNALQWMGAIAVFLIAATGARATVEAMGGDYTYDKMIEGSRYRIHVFINAGPSTLTVTQGGEVEYLVVGGGGAGGYGVYGGGGGGGAVLSNIGAEKLVLAPQSFAVQVGTGGLGSDIRGKPGSISVFDDIEAPGGGGGGRSGSGDQSPGGAGSSGGGGSCYSGTAGSGGLGGGALGRKTYGSGTHAAPNTGGGGGSAVGSSLSYPGGNGGSGIVVIRYVVKSRGTVVMIQ